MGKDYYYFRKFPLLFLLKSVFSRGNDSLRSDVYPWNSYLMMPKSLFLLSKMIFLTKNYTPYVFQPFLTKRKIFMTSRLKNDCNNPLGRSIFLKFSQIMAKSHKIWEKWRKCFRVAANTMVVWDKLPPPPPPPRRQ